MKKKILFVALILIGLVTFTGCQNKEKAKDNDNKSALEFKEEYEALNGKKNSSGKEHRTITISKDNPFEKITPKELVEKLDNKETFYVYFGDPLCPWCRSVIEEAIKVAKDEDIDKIYYIKIWDDDGNEVLRDKYELQKGKPVKVGDGTKEYNTFLKSFGSLLDDYTLTNDKGDKVKVGEKRIYAPDFLYIEKGKAKKITDGISSKQTDARQKLTDEILKDEEKAFEELFDN